MAEPLDDKKKEPSKFGGFVDELAAGNRKAAVSVLIGREKDAAPKDWRVRMSVAPDADYLYKDKENDLMKPLLETNGVVFPYTPRITMMYNANYETKHPTHSNYPIHNYKNSGVSTISISGDFTAQTPIEAAYLLATMQFFRASTKMFWGRDDQAGMPPPVLYLNGYGAHFFPNIPVVVTSFASDLGDEVDYVETTINDDLSRVPSKILMSITCEPIYSREKVHDDFTFQEFAEGTLLDDYLFGGGFV